MRLEKQRLQQDALRMIRRLHRLSVSAGSLGRIWWTGCCLAFVAMGVTLLWSTFEAFSVSDASKTWPAIPCKIIISSAQERYREQGIGRAGNTYRYYYAEPFVICEYIIGDQGLTMNERTYRYNIPTEERFQGLTRAKNKSRAEKWSAEHYPKGRLIEIFYNPENPQQAVLTRGKMTWRKTVWYSGIGILLIVLGIVMFVSLHLSSRLNIAL